MTKEEFKLWRSIMNLTQKDVALEFEVTRNTIQNYELGYTHIPKAVELACKFLRIKKEML